METQNHNTKMGLLINAASLRAGSLRKLAKKVHTSPAALIALRNGERPPHYKMNGRLKAAAGENPAKAFIDAVIEDLAGTEDEAEKEAAAAFIAISAMLDAKSAAPALARG